MKIVHFITILLTISSLGNFCFAQITAKNAVYVELGGNVSMSINYEKIFYQREKLKMGARVGLAVMPGQGSTQISVPLEWNVLFGKSRKYFELGVGYTNGLYIASSKSTAETNYDWIMIAPRIGYRFQKDEGGFLFRIGLTPILSIYKEDETNRTKTSYWPLWLGISLGKSF
jgi:hypothetical protein